MAHEAMRREVGGGGKLGRSTLIIGRRRLGFVVISAWTRDISRWNRIWRLKHCAPSHKILNHILLAPSFRFRVHSVPIFIPTRTVYPGGYRRRTAISEMYHRLRHSQSLRSPIPDQAISTFDLPLCLLISTPFRYRMVLVLSLISFLSKPPSTRSHLAFVSTSRPSPRVLFPPIPLTDSEIILRFIPITPLHHLAHFFRSPSSYLLPPTSHLSNPYRLSPLQPNRPRRRFPTRPKRQSPRLSRWFSIGHAP